MEKNTTVHENTEKEIKKPLFVPKIDIYSDDANIYLLGDFPGVLENALEVSLEKDTLTIEGKVSPSALNETELKYSEYRVGDFRRVFTLNENVDADKIEATLKNGALRVVLPRTKPVTKKIEVKTN